jgi:hypothetical protein
MNKSTLASVFLYIVMAVPFAHAVPYTFTLIANTQGVHAGGFFGIPAINNAGVVAFKSCGFAGCSPNTLGGGQGLFIGDGITTNMIADSSGPFIQFQSTPDINDSGAVSFDLTADPQSSGFASAVYKRTVSGLTLIADDSAYQADPSLISSWSFLNAGGINKKGSRRTHLSK